MKKKLYEVPEAEQFFVKYEENIMSPTFSSKGTETMTVEEEEDF